jgi:lipoyl(octanoyl) transferase
MEMVQVSQLGGPDDVAQVETKLVEELVTLLGYDHVELNKAAKSASNNEK